MEDTRKYFDYKLAYDGYKKVKELLDKGGIQAVIDNDEFDVSCSATIEDWKENGYIPINAFGYNATIFINDRNFDTNNKENDWYVSGEVDIYSYSGGDDTIYINDISNIKDRIMNLINYAKINNYTLNDLYAEYDSLISVLKKLNESECEE